MAQNPLEPPTSAPLDMVLLAGSANRRLAQSIADYLGHPLVLGEARHFSEGNTFVRVPVNVREQDVFLVQGTGPPANDNFMELLFWIDALKRASAASVTVVMPYFSYAKGDKKDEPRVSIRARVCADAIEAAGADRVVTMDLHAPQVVGFFRVPVDDLYALPVLCDAVADGMHAVGNGMHDGTHNAAANGPHGGTHDGGLVVVSPDAGFAKKARQYANRLAAPVAIADKRRVDHTEAAEVLDLIGDVEGRRALIVDDFTISGGTLIDAARLLVERGASSVSAAVSHSLLQGEALQRLLDSHIDRLLVTDTIERALTDADSKIVELSVARLFGEAIRRIALRQSVSVLFE